MNLLTTIQNEFKVMFMAMLPIIELRGAIPIGVALGLSHIESLFFAYIGSIIPAPFILILIKPVLRWMHKTKMFKKLADKMIEKNNKNRKTIDKYGTWGLLIFVAMPLPGTGVWSGSLLAALLNIRIRFSLLAIVVGNLIAGLAILSLTYGITSFTG